MDNKIETASQKFISGYNCAQSVLFAYSDNVGIDKDTALKISCGFGGGMGRRQEVCGAVTGGIIAIGAKFGRGENDDQALTEKTYAKTKELLDKFQTKHGTFICLELLDGCNLSDEKGQEYFKENNLKNKICNECIKDAVEILEEILAD
ncbi:MAG: C-GCAxxG-C-C family protein [Ignavibacteria bacterium]|jgi:C_GCAxxG_C_C family probable redox protein